MNTPRRLLTSATVVLSLIIGSGLFVETPIAQAKQPTLVASRFARPKPPSRGTPGNAGRGAASRSCMELAQKSDQPMLNSLNALVPEYPNGKAIDVWGLTTSEHPTFWFYVPYTNAGIESIEFVLQNDQEQTVQKISVPVPAKPGIINVQLPSTKPGLEVDELYNWFFKVRGKCADNLVVYVEGWIGRTSLPSGVSDRLRQATPQQKAALLAEQGIWYDALTTLAELHFANPQNAAIAADWSTLLKEADMEPLAKQAIVSGK